MASFQFFGKAVLKALRWKPRATSVDQMEDSPSEPHEQEPEVTAGSEVTDVSPPEVHTTELQVWLGGGSEAGNEATTEGNTSRTSTPTAELTQPTIAETPEKKTSSLRRRKFGVFMRPGSAKSFDADSANAKRDSKKGRKKFLSHVRTLSMGHSTPRPDADTTTLQSTPTKSAPHLHLGGRQDSTDTPALGGSVTEINVIDVDGDVNVFDNEV